MIFLFNNCYLSTTKQILEKAKHIWIGSHPIEQDLHSHLTFDIYKSYDSVDADILDKLFEDIYDEVYGAIDAFAENIRKIKAYTPASLSRFSTLTEVNDETGILEPQAMVAELLADAEKMQEIMKLVFQEAEDRGEHGLSNFLADRQDAFAKHAWFLRATAKV